MKLIGISVYLIFIYLLPLYKVVISFRGTQMDQWKDIASDLNMMQVSRKQFEEKAFNCFRNFVFHPRINFVHFFIVSCQIRLLMKKATALYQKWEFTGKCKIISS